MSESEQKVAEGAPTEESAEGTTTAVATEVSALTAETPTEAPAERPKTPPKGSKSYELIFLVDAGLPKEELDALIEKVQGAIEQRDGIVENVRISDVRRLAYEIKKRTHGVYVVINFWLFPSQIAELERLLRLDERVLRHMVIHTRSS
jgi:small subunit ribosomal protein S6